MQTDDFDTTPAEQRDLELETLLEWAERFATSRTGMFNETAAAAEIVLGLFQTDEIGYAP